MVPRPPDADEDRDAASPQPRGGGARPTPGLDRAPTSGAPGEPRSEGGSEDGAARPVVRKGLVPRALLDPDAVAVVRRLQRFGHEAYLVGGCVRNLIAGHEPKDFDVATGARPNQIKRLFRNARIIGRRFRLAHIHFDDGHIVEASTFRGEPDKDEPRQDEPRQDEPRQDEPRQDDPRRDEARREEPSPDDARADDVDAEDVDVREDAEPRWAPQGARRAERFGDENVFGTAAEDARRRDLTVNALFYDPVADTVIDWVGGLADLDARTIRCIGEPDVRLVEDPVRMIRAAHFAERLGFHLEPGLEASIAAHASHLERASGARLYVELQKLLGRGHARGTLKRLHERGVLRAWVPQLADHLDDGGIAWPSQGGGTHEEASRGEPEGLPAAHATWNLLGAADRWGLAAHGAPESLALAALFGAWLLETLPPEAGRDFTQFSMHVDATFRPVALRMSIPRRAYYRMAEILYMLLDLRHPPGPRRIRRLVSRPSFGEALALFRLDLMARDADLGALDSWEERAGELRGGRRSDDGDDGDGPRRGRRRGRRGRGPERSEGEPSEGAARIAPEASSWDEAPAPIRPEAPRSAEPPPPPRAATPPPPPPPSVPPAPRPAPAPVETPRAAPRPERTKPDDFSAGIL